MLNTSPPVLWSNEERNDPNLPLHIGLVQTQKSNKGRVLQLVHSVTQMHICIDPKKIIFLMPQLTIMLELPREE